MTSDDEARAALAKHLTFGYDRSELEAAFELVKPAIHWKMPIDAIVPADTDLGKLEKAVIFFCGCNMASKTMPDGSIHVTAPGYFATIGA